MSVKGEVDDEGESRVELVEVTDESELLAHLPVK